MVIDKELDAIDKQLIELLIEDGRMKLVDLGRRLKTTKKEGYSHVGVKKRLHKLEEEGILKVQANLNLRKLRLVMGLVLLETGSYETLREVMAKYEDCPRILFSFQTSEKFNVVQGILAENIQELEAYINFCSAKNHPGVRSSLVLISTMNFNPVFFPVRFIRNNKLQHPPCGSDCTSCAFFESKDCAGCPVCACYRGSY
ncbi:MAG: Lrp/AsnC family transcriptional regulator [Promethearchaeota archaeon]